MIQIAVVLSTNDIIELQRKVAIDRDLQSYRQLFNYFSKPLIRFSDSIVKSKEAAEEVYSDAMLKIWNLGNGLIKISNLRTYLFTIVKNYSLYYLSKYKKVSFIDIDDIDVDIYHAHCIMDNVLVSEFNKQVYLSIKSLPSKCQLVYKLIKEDGFNYKEVSDILEISLKTVEGHMTKALKTIHTSIKQYWYSSQN